MNSSSTTSAHQLLWALWTGENDHSPPAIDFNPCFSSTRQNDRSIVRPSAGTGRACDSNRSRKNGMLSSQGIRRKEETSGMAVKSPYPSNTEVELCSVLNRTSCMSQPNNTELKPKPCSMLDRNLSLSIILPRKMPSQSIPATLTL